MATTHLAEADTRRFTNHELHAGRSTISARALAALLRIEMPVESTQEQISFPTRQVQAGEALVRAGEECRGIYVVRCGSFKTMFLDPSGTEQGLGFPMASDTIGIDGLADGHYMSDAYALERSEVVVISSTRVAELSHHSFFATLLYRLIGREISSKQAILFALGSLGAEARLATFLLDLSERFGSLGYSRTCFNLRMTRNEIASYLGLKIETVSRGFSAFALAGILRVNNREIEILDPAALRHTLSAPPGESVAHRPRVQSAGKNRASVVTRIAPRRRTSVADSASLCAA